jgi:hypothetical protein
MTIQHTSLCCSVSLRRSSAHCCSNKSVGIVDSVDIADVLVACCCNVLVDVSVDVVVVGGSVGRVAVCAVDALVSALVAVLALVVGVDDVAVGAVGVFALTVVVDVAVVSDVFAFAGIFVFTSFASSISAGSVAIARTVSLLARSAASSW